MTDVKLNSKCYIAMLEMSLIYTNKTIGVRSECLKPLNCVQTNY